MKYPRSNELFRGNRWLKFNTDEEALSELGWEYHWPIDDNWNVAEDNPGRGYVIAAIRLNELGYPVIPDNLKDKGERILAAAWLPNSKMLLRVVYSDRQMPSCYRYEIHRPGDQNTPSKIDIGIVTHSLSAALDWMSQSAFGGPYSETGVSKHPKNPMKVAILRDGKGNRSPSSMIAETYKDQDAGMWS